MPETNLKCPICGEKIMEYSWGWGCFGYKENNCKFSLGKTICDKKISQYNLEEIINNGKTDKIKGFVSKRTNKKFDATLVLNKETGNVDFSFDD